MMKQITIFLTDDEWKELVDTARHELGEAMSDEEIERLGFTLLRQAQEIEKLRKEFRLEEEDLNLDLGPLGTLL